MNGEKQKQCWFSALCLLTARCSDLVNTLLKLCGNMQLEDTLMASHKIPAPPQSSTFNERVVENQWLRLNLLTINFSTPTVEMFIGQLSGYECVE